MLHSECPIHYERSYLKWLHDGLNVAQYFVSQVSFITELTDDIYNNYANRRLEGVMKSLATSSPLKCTTLCSETDGCLAVNIIGNHDITCELTTGLSNENEFLVDPGSRVFVLGTWCISIQIW